MVNLYRLRELLSLGFYRCNTTEKQWYRPNRLPGIAYLFELKGGMPCTYANKNVGQP